MLIIVLQCKKVQLLVAVPCSATVSCNCLKVCVGTGEHSEDRQELLRVREAKPGWAESGAVLWGTLVGPLCLCRCSRARAGGTVGLCRASHELDPALPPSPTRAAEGLFCAVGAAGSP